MRILTDTTDRSWEWLASLLAPESVKQSFSLVDDRISQAWWARLGAQTPQAWHVVPAPGLDAWRHVVLVSDAPRSQYDVLVESARAEAHLAGPVATLALTGRGFHGNRGRPWRAVAGNLHLSAALPVDLPAARAAGGVSALAAVATISALRAVCGEGLDTRLKWVNDVLVGDAKLAGVIAATQSRGDRLTAIVLGIGVNIRVAPPVPPTLCVPRVTCLADHPAGATAAAQPGRLVAALLAAIAGHVAQLQRDGSAALVDAYRNSCRDVGRTVRIWAEGLPDAARADQLPPPLAAGKVVAIADDLSLRIAGHEDPIVGGRMAYDDRGNSHGRPA